MAPLPSPYISRLSQRVYVSLPIPTVIPHPFPLPFPLYICLQLFFLSLCNPLTAPLPISCTIFNVSTQHTPRLRPCTYTLLSFFPLAQSFLISRISLTQMFVLSSALSLVCQPQISYCHLHFPFTFTFSLPLFFLIPQTHLTQLLSRSSVTSTHPTTHHIPLHFLFLSSHAPISHDLTSPHPTVLPLLCTYSIHQPPQVYPVSSTQLLLSTFFFFFYLFLSPTFSNIH